MISLSAQRVEYDVVVIGAGISGLTAASLLAKRGLSVAVVDKSYNPGGSCGAFRRGAVTFDQGAAMLYGFGENGFNAHRFVFNSLEEHIDVVQHELLYCITYKGHRIRFWPDVHRFADELSEVFPQERANIHRFYHDMLKLYQDVLIDSPSYTTPDETDFKEALRSMARHPRSYIRFLRLLNRPAKQLLQQYFSDPDIFKFFDKLTSTYCYTTVEESPAVLAAVMFVDNHVGGSFYPAGSTLFLPGKLEKVIEEHGGDMLLDQEVVSIVFEGGKPTGVALASGQALYARDIVYSGTVWNLYGKLIDPLQSTSRRRDWAIKQVPTYPSVVLYAVVDREAIPEDTAPIEMLASSADKLDEGEVTAYILSIDDRTLCAEDEHTVVAIGPTFEDWHSKSRTEYLAKKDRECNRLVGVLENRFPGISKALRYKELASPGTIERYTLKNGGAVAGPKQMLGQHMLHRLHTRTEWPNLYCCGESTVMGTGTPTVTTSGVAAANAILRKLGNEPYVFRGGIKQYVHVVDKPFTPERLFERYEGAAQDAMREAMRCRFCEHPTCTTEVDVRGIMRRVVVGNFTGAKKCWLDHPADASALQAFQGACIRAREDGMPVNIRAVVAYLNQEKP